MSKPKTPPTLIERSGKFFVRYTDKGHLRTKPLPVQGRADARRVIAEYCRGWYAGTWPPRQRIGPSDFTIRSLLERYVRERDMEAGTLTARSLVENICGRLGHVTVQQLKAHHLHAYMALEVASRSRQTISNEIARLAAAMRWAKIRWQGWQDIPDPPSFKRTGAGRREAVWTTEEVRQILTACGDCKDDEFATFVVLVASTGCRPKAAHELTWDRIDFQANRIDFKVPGSPDTKKRPQRNLKVQPSLIELLAFYGERGGGNETRVFTRPLATLRAQLIAFVKGLGLPTGTFVTFRHSFITNALEKGLSVVDVAKYVATSPAMILRNYAKPSSTVEERGASLYA